MRKTVDFQRNVLEIVEEEEKILQSNIIGKLDEKVDLSDYERGAVRSKISDKLKILEAMGKVELEGGHSPEHGGRTTNKVTFTGGE